MDQHEKNKKHVENVPTSKMMPFNTVWESMPTFSSSKLNLSNFSGVSLLRILQSKRITAYSVSKPDLKVAINYWTILILF